MEKMRLKKKGRWLRGEQFRGNCTTGLHHRGEGARGGENLFEMGWVTAWRGGRAWPRLRAAQRRTEKKKNFKKDL